MKYYSQNGCLSNIDYFPDESDHGFFICEISATAPDRYYYPGDHIKSDLDLELVSLYDTFQSLIFPDSTLYQKQVALLPVFIQACGQDSDCSMSAREFEQELQKLLKNPDNARHLYLVDCQFLVGTVQNLLASMHQEFIRYFTLLPECTTTPNRLSYFEGKTIVVMNETSLSAAAALESYFTKAYSILDMVTKIAYEVENMPTCISTYAKLASRKILWSNQKKLSISDKPGTLFEKSELVYAVFTLRNEAVHNGSWELNPKIFIRIDGHEVVERFMLFPDIENGSLVKFQNRCHFFSNGTKVNEELPKIHLAFQQMVLKTLFEVQQLAASKLK